MHNNSLKIILLGDGRVGKTSIINKYINNEFSETEQMTINCCYSEKETMCNSKKYKLSIWDTAGQEKFNALTPIYYRDAKGVLLVYDITNPHSFTRVTKWVEELINYNKDAKIVLVGNKVDTDNWKVNQEDIIQYAKDHNAHHFFTSAKTGKNISEIFDCITQEIANHLKTLPKSQNKLLVSNEIENNNRSCCY